MRRLAALTLVLLLAFTAGCGRWSDQFGGSDPTTSPTDVLSGTPTKASDLVGTWSDPDAKWTVHFREDGTYSSDYQGVKDFLSGTYKLVDGQVQLISGEGDTDLGTVQGDTVVFKLGTLTRDE